MAARPMPVVATKRLFEVKLRMDTVSQEFQAEAFCIERQSWKACGVSMVGKETKMLDQKCMLYALLGINM